MGKRGVWTVRVFAGVVALLMLLACPVPVLAEETSAEAALAQLDAQDAGYVEAPAGQLATASVERRVVDPRANCRVYKIDVDKETYQGNEAAVIVGDISRRVTAHLQFTQKMKYSYIGMFTLSKTPDDYGMTSGDKEYPYLKWEQDYYGRIYSLSTYDENQPGSSMLRVTGAIREPYETSRDEVIKLNLYAGDLQRGKQYVVRFCDHRCFEENGQKVWKLVPVADFYLQFDVRRLTEEEKKRMPKDITIGGDSLKFTIPKGIALIGGTNIQFGKGVIPFQYQGSKDGTHLLTLNLSTSQAKLLNSLSSSSAEADLLASATKKRDSLVASGKHVQWSPIQPTWNVAGFYRWNPLIPKKRGGMLSFMYGLQGGCQGQWGPITAEFMFKGLAGAQGAFGFDSAGALTGTMGIKGNLTAKLAAGLGVAYLGRVGVYGQGGLDLLFQMMPRDRQGWENVTLSGSFGAEVVALGYSIFDWEILKGSWPIVKRSTLSGQAIEETLEQAGLTGAHLDGDILSVPLPRDYLDRTGEWLGEQDVRVESPQLTAQAADDRKKGLPLAQVDPRLLQANTYPDAHVQVVQASSSNASRKVMVWLRDNASRNAANRSELVYSVSDNGGNTWSSPQPVVAGDATADFEPELATDGKGNCYVTWLNATQQLASGQRMEEIADKFEVCCAKFAGSGSWAMSKVAPAAAGKAKTSPQVAAYGPTVVVGWSTYETSHLKDLGGKHTVTVATQQNGGAWSLREVVGNTDKLITSLEAGVIGNQVGVAWTDNADLSTGQEATMGTVNVARPGQQAGVQVGIGSNVKFVQKKGVKCLTWRGKKVNFVTQAEGDEAEDAEAEDDGCLWCLGSMDGEPELVYDGGDLPAVYDLDGDLADGALVSYAVSADDDANLYGMNLTDGKLSDESLLVTHADDITAWDVCGEGDNLQVAFVAERGLGDPSKSEGDLCIADVNSTRFLELESAELLGEMKPGNTVQVYAQVRNAGISDIYDGVTLKVFEGGNEISNASSTETLKSGESVELVAEIKLPDDFVYDPNRRYVAAACYGATAGAARADELELDASGAGVADAEAHLVFEDEHEGARFVVRNCNVGPLSGQLVAVGIKEDGDEVTLDSFDVSGIAANDTREFTVWSAGDQFVDEGIECVELRRASTEEGEDDFVTLLPTYDGVVVDELAYELPEAQYVSGWLGGGDEWFLLDDEGSFLTGWQQVEGHWYHLDPPTRLMNHGWFQDADGAWYWLHPVHDGRFGEMRTGWVWDGSAWYWMEASGRMRTGWLWQGGSWYWLRPSGAMATGWIQDGSAWYWLQPSGAMLSNARTPDGYWVDASGRWVPGA